MSKIYFVGRWILCVFFGVSDIWFLGGFLDVRVCLCLCGKEISLCLKDLGRILVFVFEVCEL
jgi:hypothetical protein